MLLYDFSMHISVVYSCEFYEEKIYIQRAKSRIHFSNIMLLIFDVNIKQIKFSKRDIMNINLKTFKL